MSLVLLAFDSSIAVGSALVDCKSIADAGMATQSGDGYVVDKRMKKLYAAWAFGGHLTRAQIQTPTFNQLAYQEIIGKSLAAAAAYERNNSDYYGAAGRALTENETLIAQVIQNNSVAENDRVFALVGDADPAPVKDPYFTIRFTMSTTLVADAWTNCAITLDRNLPAGNYKVVGMKVYSAGGLAFRLRIVGSEYAPGGMCVQSIEALSPEWQLNGNLGVWGTFAQNLLPTIDILSTSADTSETGEMQLVKA